MDELNINNINIFNINTRCIISQELYKEILYDLLSDRPREQCTLEIREDTSKDSLGGKKMNMNIVGQGSQGCNCGQRIKELEQENMELKRKAQEKQKECVKNHTTRVDESGDWSTKEEELLKEVQDLKEANKSLLKKLQKIEEIATIPLSRAASTSAAGTSKDVNEGVGSGSEDVGEESEDDEEEEEKRVFASLTTNNQDDDDDDYD